MARRKRRGFGMHHDTYKVSKVSLRGRPKKLNVIVSINRTTMGMYTAFACAKFKGSVRASHCGELSGGKTPTKAAANALARLGAALSRAR